jgi:uncharacterized protein
MLSEYIGIAELNDLIARSAEIECVASVSELERVREVTFDSAAAGSSVFNIVLGFKSAMSGLPSLAGTIDGELELECQRCLEPMRWISDIAFQYALQMAGPGKNAQVDLFEAVEVTDRGLLLKELIEDELLSAIPLAPKHDDEKLCARLIAAEVEPEAETRQEEMHQPFTDLANLLSSKRSDQDDGSNK